MEHQASRLESSVFFLNVGLSSLEQEWLAETLKRRQGIEEVAFGPWDAARLVVNHDADITAPLAVHDLLLLHGVDVKFTSTVTREARGGSGTAWCNGAANVSRVA